MRANGSNTSREGLLAQVGDVGLDGESVGPVGLVGDAGGGKWGDMAGWESLVFLCVRKWWTGRDGGLGDGDWTGS